MKVTNLLLLCIAFISACNSGQRKTVSSAIALQPATIYTLYEGKYDSLPNFSTLIPAHKGTTDSIGLHVADTALKDFAVVFNGKLSVHEPAKYRLTVTGFGGDLTVDGKKILRYGKGAAYPANTIIELAAGEHNFELSYFGGRRRNPLRIQAELYPLLVNDDRFDRRHAIYFGWNEDHPKAVSLMGGALYARRPRLLTYDDHSWNYSLPPWHQNSASPVLFMLAVNGGEPFYPDEQAPSRKQDIQWKLAEDYLPSPLSQWTKDNISISIQHAGRRLLNNSVNAVYTRVTLTNNNNTTQKASLVVNGEGVMERVFALTGIQWNKESAHELQTDAELKAGESRVFDFIIPANGVAQKQALLHEGGFDKHFAAMKKETDEKMAALTHPVSLPDDKLIDMWKSSMPYMWNATVKTPVDYEQRGSGGNVFGFYQYDRVFNHDVPDMVNQYILEGNWDIARQILTGATYEALSNGIMANEQYLDAIPKYIISMALYLQVSGDTAFFTPALLQKIKRCAQAVHDMRVPQLDPALKGKGPYGLLKKGATLDNGSNHLVVDNFAALHSFAAYIYLFTIMNGPAEVAWARKEMEELNNCLNDALVLSMKKNNKSWYNACFTFDYNEHLLSGPGNWLGTTLMMSSFPWNAWLKGYNLGGAWKDHFDRSVEEWINRSKSIGNPDGSFGAWWDAKYGSIYNTGMGLQLLYSNKYRTEVAKSIEWLVANQSVPWQWGESFNRPEPEGNWTRPQVDLETWGLGFIRMGLLQLCVSVSTDGTVILGRGIPANWLNSGKEIAWKNVHLNNGKKTDISFRKNGNTITVLLNGNPATGNLVVDIPLCTGNIAAVNVKQGRLLHTDARAGKVTCTGDTKEITIRLQQ